MDKAISAHERTAENESYIIRVRNRIEADGEFKNLSANQIGGMRQKTMTLPERLLLELWYFWKTGKHLDIKNYTLCAGSRDTGGDVPRVRWNDDGLRVDRDYPGPSYDSLRSRAAV